jgi:hypothetical protein
MELSDQEIKEKMMEYTLFYAQRFNQLVTEHQQISIHQAASIDSAMLEYGEQYGHILFMAAGVRIFDMSILFDIVEEIEANPHYLAAAHILDWGDRWYELHQQFILVNCENHRKCGSPQFGGWEAQTHRLPVIGRSVENFHDGYTPLWIKFTGEWQDTHHTHPGWNYLSSAAEHGMSIINWNHTIRRKRTYYYPEDHSQEFLQSLSTLTNCGVTNRNQQTLIKQLGNVKDQIWLLNSEDMSLPQNKYDTIALPASGFKFLEVFNKDLLKPSGELIIYDYNPKSLEWIKFLHASEQSVMILVQEFEHRRNFKILGGEVFSTDGKLTKYYLDSLWDTMKYFGDDHEATFIRLLKRFKEYSVKFVEANLLDSPNALTDNFRGNTLLNISNIFCTDFSNAVWGMGETDIRFNKMIAALPTSTHIVGHDPQCQAIDRVYTPQTTR